MITLTYIILCVDNATGRAGYSWRVTKDWDAGNIHFGTSPETLGGGACETREDAECAANAFVEGLK